MIKGYTSEILVEGELLTSITSSTSPNSSQLSTWIEEVESEIDELTETSYTEVTVTDEIMPYDDSNGWISDTKIYPTGRSDAMSENRCSMFFTYNGIKVKPILSVISLYRNTQSDDSNTDGWELLTEQTGSGGDFIVNKPTGMLTFIRNKPNWGSKRALKSTFKYGGTAFINPLVRTLATKMVARRVLNAKVMKSQMSSIDDISLESITIQKGANKTVTLMKYLDQDIENIKNKLVGTLKVDIV